MVRSRARLLLLTLVSLCFVYHTHGVTTGYLGISSDTMGIVLQPSPTLASLRSSYEFWHHHLLSAGNREWLGAIEAAGDSMSIRLVIQLRPLNESSSLLLSLLGGRVVVETTYVVPAETSAGSCGSTKIHSETTTLPQVDNSSHTAGGCMCSTTFCRCQGPLDRYPASPVPNGSKGTPEWCKQMCCADDMCMAWTFDALGRRPNGQHAPCYLRYRDSPLITAPATRMQQWSGGRHVGARSVFVNGRSLGAHRPAVSADESSGPEYVRLPPIEIFIDGSMAQVFFNGEQYSFALASVAPNSTASQKAFWLVSGANALIGLDVWQMQP